MRMLSGWEEVEAGDLVEESSRIKDCHSRPVIDDDRQGRVIFWRRQ